MESIRGTIDKVTFKSDTFHILSLETDVGKRCTAKGHIFGLLAVSWGLDLELLGSWVKDPKYGLQFQIQGWRPWADLESSMERFLSLSVGIPHRGLITKIVSFFRKDTYNVMSKEPERVTELLKDTPQEAEEILELWNAAVASSDLSDLFSDYSLSANQISGIFKAFGSEARKVIEANPYDLVRVESFPFGKVDEIAQKMGLKVSDPRRYEGAVLWVLQESSRSGHLCVKGDALVSTLKSIQGTSDVFGYNVSLSEELDSAVERLVLRKSVVVDSEVGVYLPELYKYERESASMLSRFIGAVDLPIDVPTFLNNYETAHSIQLSDAQKEAVHKLVSSKVLVLTGLPGSGKTTCVKALVSLLEQSHVSFSLMAPTGIAAKRLASVTGHDAGTIHRTFGFDGTAWKYDKYNKYPVQAVILDECSMIDMELMYHILDALNEDTMLILVGDDAQLPSVGPGNVLRELSTCPSLPTVRLTQIFRQAHTSEIVVNAHRIHNGEPIQVEKGSGGEFQFVSLQDEDKIVYLIVEAAKKLKSRDENYQVLSPMYAGKVGIDNLNAKLQEALNPAADSKKELLLGTVRFREGDRLRISQNDYKLGVYNGDMGKLLQICHDCLRVKVFNQGGFDRIVDFPKKDILSKLKLSYATSIHNVQGSEFDTVLMPITTSQGRMLQRNLLYTAITRAKKKVWLIGSSVAVGRAIANDKVVERNTGLAKALREAILAGVSRVVPKLEVKELISSLVEISKSDLIEAVATLPADTSSQVTNIFKRLLERRRSENLDPNLGTDTESV